MENKQIFQKYYSRLAIEGIVKAAICGLIVGFSLCLIPVVIGLFNNANFNWIAIIVLIVVAGATTPLFYRLFFRPKVKQIAERIDRLGLEERLITMMELESDESYIAMRQREDAKEKLSYVHSQNLKLSIVNIPLFIMSALFVFCVVMFFVASNNVEGRLAWTRADDIDFGIVDNRVEDEKEDYFIVEYIIWQGSGYIEGDQFQVVRNGEDATPIEAVPLEGFAFVDWFDTAGGDSKEPARHDQAISEDFAAFARFQPKGEGEGEDESDEPDPDQPPQPKDDPDASGEFDPNLIIDGTIYYADDDVFYEYYDKVIQILISGQTGADVPSELLNFIQYYFEALRPASPTSPESE